ncbi:MAG: nicotinamide-nucleotide amidohydrolase family protein [Oscillospiraceae bacterium]|nr:nicotinamide-nucleotide amidohydrolase family protein [Oscillospiraceae bacterium]
MTYEQRVRAQWREITQTLIEKNISVTTMESCTSGLLASLISDTEGASAVMKGAFVTYSNEAKIMQGVPAETIEQYSVYSAETARAMAEACAKTYRANIGIGVTGTMGNIDPANAAASVKGQVYFALCVNGTTTDYALSLPPQPTRYEYKLLVAEHICAVLLPLLQQMGS